MLRGNKRSSGVHVRLNEEGVLGAMHVPMEGVTHQSVTKIRLFGWHRSS